MTFFETTLSDLALLILLTGLVVCAFIIWQALTSPEQPDQPEKPDDNQGEWQAYRDHIRARNRSRRKARERAERPSWVRGKK